MGFDKGRALQITVIVLGIIGLISLYLAIIPIDEKRYCEPVKGEVGLIESLKLTFKNTPFIPYLFGTICLWFGLNIVSSSAIHYVRVLLDKPEDFTSVVLGAVFGVALIFFPIINLASRYIQKRLIMLIGLAVFAMCSALIFFLGSDILPFTPVIQAFIIFGVLGIPVSVLLVVPNAILSDLAEYDAIKTGTKREAMYFGAQGLLQKINLGISTAILGYLFAAHGKDVVDPLGVKLSGPITAVVCIIGFIIYLYYPEKTVMDALEKKRK
jgi:GPH family glycoside/pentoside/hexuronide:cation symporter